MTGRRLETATFVLSLIVLTTLLTGCSLFHSRSDDIALNEFERVLRRDDYALAKPPRSDWLPGTVLLYEKGTIHTYIGSEKLLGKESTEQRTFDVKLTSSTLTVDTGNDGEAKFGYGQLSGDFVGTSSQTVTVALRDMVGRSVDRASLEALLKGNEQIKTALKNPSYRLYVITEAIVAHNAEISVQSDGSNSGDIDVIAKTIFAGNFSANITRVDSSRLLIEKPLVVGFKVAEVRRIAQTLGGAGEVKIAPDLSVEEAVKLGGIPPAVSRSKPGAHIHALCVGLDLYTSGIQGLPGGHVPGAPNSASFVWHELSTFALADSESSVTLFAPSLDSTIRERVTLAELSFVIDNWMTDRKRAIEERRTRQPTDDCDIFILYFCGHGLVSSESGDSFLLPESFAVVQGKLQRPFKPDNTVALCIDRLGDIPRNLNSLFIVLADCCRREDGVQENIIQNPPPFGNKPNTMGKMLAAIQANARAHRDLRRWPVIVWAVPIDEEAVMVPSPFAHHHGDLGPLAVVLGLELRAWRAWAVDYSVEQFVASLCNGWEYSGTLYQGWCNRFRPKNPQWLTKIGYPLIHVGWPNSDIKRLVTSTKIAVPNPGQGNGHVIEL